MDYEALKDQWSEIEDRDGIRLSWNTFPSTRMVRLQAEIMNMLPTLNRKHRDWWYLLVHFTLP